METTQPKIIRPVDEQHIIKEAAPDLLAASQRVIANWEHGDLAAAVRELAAVIALATPTD